VRVVSGIPAAVAQDRGVTYWIRLVPKNPNPCGPGASIEECEADGEFEHRPSNPVRPPPAGRIVRRVRHVRTPSQPVGLWPQTDVRK
jgi:hypothetical protein